MERYKDRPLVLRPTREHHRRVYLWNDSDSAAYAVHEGDDLFPVTEPTRVRVRDADPETDHIAERVEPGQTASALFSTDDADGLIEAVPQEMRLGLRNVDRWERAQR